MQPQKLRSSGSYAQISNLTISKLRKNINLKALIRQQHMLWSSRSYAQILNLPSQKNFDKYDPISVNHAAIDTAVQRKLCPNFKFHLPKNLEKDKLAKMDPYRPPSQQHITKYTYDYLFTFYTNVDTLVH